MKNTELILFDFDGTIFDTGDGITRGVAFALSHFGIEVKDLSVLHPFVGPPLKDSFNRYYGLNDEQCADGVDFYRQYYTKHGLAQCHPYEGIEHMLASVKAAGKIVLLATSKPQKFAEEILRNHDLLKYFDAVNGATMDEKRNDKSDVIAYALESYAGIPRENMLMVGDTKYDTAGANKQGIDCVGVLYGYGSRAELENEGTKYIVATVKELEDLLL